MHKINDIISKTCTESRLIKDFRTIILANPKINIFKIFSKYKYMVKQF